MFRMLFKLVLVLVILVAAVTFFLGYQLWGDDEPAARTTDSDRVITAPDTADEEAQARQAGAEIGARVGAAAERVESAAANAALTAKITSKITLDDTLDNTRINVDSRDGAVTLRGQVNTATERERALQLARETEGVTSVVDQLAGGGR